MSYPAHLITINNHYYYRISIPVDLKPYFPITILQKSLRTSNIKEARPLLLSTEYKVQRVFAQLRTGMLDDNLSRQLVNEIIPRKAGHDSKRMEGKREAADKADTALSNVIEKYIADKQGEWTEKTKMEVGSVVKLLQDILGDIDVSSITKPVVLDLRSTLQKLPPNIYKKYPGKSIKQVLECKDIEPMSLKSVNKHVARLGAVLRHCVDEGILTSNPASGLKISEKKRADEERSSYSMDDVKQIIRNVPRNQETPERYWIPLIGLYIH